ncbi:hypothetical protein E4K64_25560 [Bradyrhizobium frederickii]|uniref:Uncharacterized protein n=1 Tax=Bradyrhizobium frederickii TaxID=2560054 RepID=A0A4Y9NWT5_9BRAD|nr:hypothetical protein [Bradyrhizobium frederickii]TFV71698.1 hypothetical protein E4K64_25560 [Bradyrhizobium frederickii]
MKLAQSNDVDAFVRRLVDIANQHAVDMKGMNEKAALKHVNAIIDAGQIVFGVYQDPLSATGVGYKVIKGARELGVVAVSHQAEQFAISAIPCVSAEQAMAAAALLGDGQRKSH